MAKMGVWSVGTVEITADDGEVGVAVLVVDEGEEGVVANDVFAGVSEGEAMKQSLEAAFQELGRPRKIVVKTGAHAKALRAAGLRETIEVGGTPALDALMEELESEIEEMLNAPGPLDGEGATAEHLRDFFTAAEVLRAMAPWALFPPGTGFAVEVPEMAIEEGSVFVVSEDEVEEDEVEEDEVEEDEVEEDEELDEPGGWMFVDTPEDFEAIADMVAGEGRERASVLALSYERVEELGDAFESFAREHSLEVSQSGWVPLLSRSKRGEGVVAVSGREYELATSICAAIANIAAHFVQSEDEEMEGVCAELTTRSGMVVTIEGPVVDEDADDEDGEEE